MVEIMNILKVQQKVYVNDLSDRFKISKVSIRKYLTELEEQGLVVRFYGGASIVQTQPTDAAARSFYSDAHWINLAHRACEQISDGDSIFVGSGRSCCVLAREMTGFKNLTVVTNNITALDDLNRNASKVYMIGGEVTSIDNLTMFSSWESPMSMLKQIFVNKAFTSVSGLDLNAGLTVNSIISTYMFKQIITMAQYWYLIADSTKFDKIAIYKIADLDHIHAIITDNIPPRYAEKFKELNVRLIR